MATNSLAELLGTGTAGGTSIGDLLGRAAASTAASGDSGRSSISNVETQASSSGVNEHLTSLANQIASLASSQQSQVGAIQENTQAVSQNTSSRSSSGGSIGNAVADVASGFFGGGLSSLSPILGGILSLFGGSDEKTVTVPAPFTLPTAINAQAGLTNSALGQVVAVNYAEGGQPRAQAQSAAPQVMIQVNAMDSRSFLDHSNEIALAVKHAILNSSSLNDVISDL